MLTISSARTRATPEPDATVLLKEPDVQGDRACAWVISRGFDPVHLCVEVQSMRNPKITSTALYEACVLGEFDIAKDLTVANSHPNAMCVKSGHHGFTA